MKKILINGGKLACLLFLLNVETLTAQPGGGTEPGNEIPIDGGISLLAAAGVAYGAKKIYERRKEENVD